MSTMPNRISLESRQDFSYLNGVVQEAVRKSMALHLPATETGDEDANFRDQVAHLVDEV